MKTKERNVTTIVFVTIAGVFLFEVVSIAALLFLNYKQRLWEHEKRVQACDDAASQLQQRLTPELCSRLRCTVSGFSKGPREVTLTPKLADKASRVFLKYWLEHAEWAPDLL